MDMPKTLLQLGNANLAPAKVHDSVLVLIDFQNEYLAGPIAVSGAAPAIAVAARLLALARQAGSPVIHVAHRGRAGGMFDREAERGQIVAELTPTAGEAIVEKPRPNSFSGTDLLERVEGTGLRQLIVAGFMTHMCVSSTARAASDLDLSVTIPANACATRDLPGIGGGLVDAGTLHEIALTALADRFAVVARDVDELS